LNLWIC